MTDAANGNNPQEFLRTGVLMLLEQARAVGLDPADAAATLHLATAAWSLHHHATEETVKRLEAVGWGR